jgi:NitT/TauT family transport system substrate-binding protein
VLPYSEYLRDLYGNALIVTDDYLKKDPAGTKRFRDALLKALKFSIEHPDEAADIMVKEVGAAANKAAAVGEIKLMTPYVTSGSGVFGEITKDRMNKAGLKPEDSVAFDLVPKA